MPLLILAFVLLTQPQFTAAPERQMTPAIAGGAEVGFVAWRDDRASLGLPQVFGSRIDARGELLDPRGIPLSDPAVYVSSLDVVRMDEQFVVLWSEGFTRLMARRVALDGTVIDDAPVQLGDRAVDSAASNGTTFAAGSRGAFVFYDAELRAIATRTYVQLGMRPDTIVIASDGDHYLVAGASGTDPFNANSVLTARLSGTGEILTPSRFVATLQPYFAPDLAWTGRDYVFVWDYAPRVYAQRLTRDGSAIGDAFVVAETSDNVLNSQSVASRGDGEAVVVFDVITGRVQENADVFGTRIGGERFDVATTERRDLEPALAVIDGAYVAAWTAPEGIDAAPLNDSGRADGIAPTTIREKTLSAEAQRYVNATRNGPAELIVWEERGAVPPRIMGRAARGGAPFLVSHSLAAQYSPAVASAGDAHLVVWHELDAASDFMAVKARRVTTSGAPLDAQPLELGRTSYAPDFTQQRNAEAPPTALWTGSAFLVAWANETTVSVARVSASGFVTTFPTHIESTNGNASQPVLAGFGNTTFLVWQEGEPLTHCIVFCIPAPAAQIRGAALDAEGNRVGSPFAIAEEPYSVRPDASWNGRWLGATWTREGKTYMQRFDRFGRSFEAPALLGDASLTARPAIFASGRDFVVAWEAPSEKPLSRIVVSNGASVNETPDARRPRFWLHASGNLVLAWEKLYASPETAGIPRIVYTAVTGSDAP